MPLSHLEHFLVQTADIAGTCDWYERVLGLRRGATPDFKFPVQWLYLGDKDVIHVTEGGAQTSENRKRYLGQLRVLAATRVQGELVFTKPVTSITEADLRAWLLTWDRSVKTKSNYDRLIHGVFA